MNADRDAIIEELWANTALRALLNELAANPVAILTRDGIKGRRYGCTDCPVSRWLMMRWPEKGAHIAVLPSSVKVAGPEGFVQPTASAIAPPAVSQFVIEFDQGKYPDLVQPAATPPDVAEFVEEFDQSKYPDYDGYDDE